MLKNQNIFLIGPMGSGKTTIGKQLAKELGRSFYDSDKEIEKRSGVSITTIFEIEGEEGFRKREIQVIDELTKLSNIVLSTGGGVVLFPENRNALSARGFVIYLKVSIAEQLKRTEKSHNRPLLSKSNNLKETLLNLQKQRESLYEEIADFTIQTETASVNNLILKILEQINQG